MFCSIILGFISLLSSSAVLYPLGSHVKRGLCWHTIVLCLWMLVFASFSALSLIQDWEAIQDCSDPIRFHVAVLYPTFNMLIDRAVAANRLVSSVHASIMASIFLYYFSSEFTTFATNNINTITSTALYIMIGYLIYDSGHELVQYFYYPMIFKIQKGDWSGLEIALHHILGLLSHMSILYYDCSVGATYLLAVYGAELSTPFLHICWLLHKLKYNTTLIFFYTSMILLLTFLIRNCIGLYLLYSMIVHYDYWEGYTVLYAVHVLIMAFFVTLNIFWLYKLLLKGRETDALTSKNKK